MKSPLNPPAATPPRIYLWIVPSEHELDQPGSWRIRKWDTEPFPEATHIAYAQPRSMVVATFSQAALDAAYAVEKPEK